MKIFAYGIRNDEIPYVEAWEQTNPEIEVGYTQELLDPETAKLAAGADAAVVYQQLDHGPHDESLVPNVNHVIEFCSPSP